ncbi:MAG TPA: hypothetical protein PKI93_07990 [Alphaproteobacteria bacterium]|nr:hypothetical protein [Alphaproteobacteria bacterium]HNS43772.1 hypothetical protein [Alphaproteobacteria bacterium]
MNDRQPTTLEDKLNSFAIKSGLTGIGGALTVSFGANALGSFATEPLSAVVNGALCFTFGAATKYGYTQATEQRAQIVNGYDR